MKYSLHIGINYVSTEVYGTDARLYGCVNDASNLQSLCDNKGFKSTKILNELATWENIEKEVTKLASQAKVGDTVVISYSGHGSLTTDLNSDEPDKQDETLVLYNKQITDDTLSVLFSKFKKGVDVIFLSDSCHSQTNLKAFGTKTARTRNLPKGVISEILKLNKGKILCNLIALTGCKDSESSYDLDSGGNFTNCLLKIVKKTPNISYDLLLSEIRKIAYTSQTPQTPQLTIYNGKITKKAFV